MLSERPQKRRWPRSQKFALSAKGTEAEAEYRELIVASRSTSGRASYDAARTAWASKWSVQPDDGVYLGQLARGPAKIEEIVPELEDCGKTRKDCIEAIDRLFDAGMIAAPTPT